VLKIVKLQIAVSEKELESIYKVLNKAMADYQSEGIKYSYRSTIVRIINEYGKWKGYINGDGSVKSEIESIKSNPEEIQHVESLVNNYKKNANMESERAILDVVYRISPDFKYPNEREERKGKILSLLEEKLGVC